MNSPRPSKETTRNESLQEHRDNFALGIAESIRARHFGNTLTADDPCLCVVPALSIFARYCDSLCPQEAEAFIKLCCWDLVRDFTPSRLGQAREQAVPLIRERVESRS